MANINQTVYHWILESTAASETPFNRKTLKDFLLSKKRPNQCDMLAVRQVVNALPVSKLVVNIHLLLSVNVKQKL